MCTIEQQRGQPILDVEEGRPLPAAGLLPGGPHWLPDYCGTEITHFAICLQAGIGTYSIPQIAQPWTAKLRKVLDMMLGHHLDAHVMSMLFWSVFPFRCRWPNILL